MSVDGIRDVNARQEIQAIRVELANLARILAALESRISALEAK